MPSAGRLHKFCFFANVSCLTAIDISLFLSKNYRVRFSDVLVQMQYIDSALRVVLYTLVWYLLSSLF